MKKYVVRIEDILSRCYIVEAEDEKQAEIIAINRANGTDPIRMSYDDWIDDSFTVEREAEENDLRTYEALT